MESEKSQCLDMWDLVLKPMEHGDRPGSKWRLCGKCNSFGRTSNCRACTRGKGQRIRMPRSNRKSDQREREVVLYETRERRRISKGLRLLVFYVAHMLSRVGQNSNYTQPEKGAEGGETTMCMYNRLSWRVQVYILQILFEELCDYPAYALKSLGYLYTRCFV